MWAAIKIYAHHFFVGNSRQLSRSKTLQITKNGQSICEHITKKILGKSSTCEQFKNYNVENNY